MTRRECNTVKIVLFQAFNRLNLRDYTSVYEPTLDLNPSLIAQVFPEISQGNEGTIQLMLLSPITGESTLVRYS